MEIQTTLRDGTLNDLVAMLKAQSDVKYDIVVPASRLSYREGNLVVAGGAQEISEEGVTERDAVLAPTERFDSTAAGRLGIPRAYMRTIRENGLRFTSENWLGSEMLLDANVNAWLQSDPDRRFMVRGFRTDDPDAIGIARALLSNQYGAMDHYDMLLGVLDGVKQAGLDTKQLQVIGNQSERNMRVQITAPQISALAPVLLGNYRSPFGGGIERVRDLAAREGMGYEPGTEPVIYAGIVASNSETGGGAWNLMPRLEVQICRNGLTVKADMLREVHIGRRLDDGVVKWSADTQKKNLELIVAQARDAVTSFLNEDYLAHVIEQIEDKATAKVKDANDTIERVATKHQFTEGEAASILECFLTSGDRTAGGVMQAVTATAQTIEDPDRAADLEDVALDVLDTVHAMARSK